MKKISFWAVVIAAFILSAIAALAADAAAPTAPTVQSEGWFTVDFIRTLISVAAGGVMSGIVTLGHSFITNRNALKLNQQKIEADKEKLRIEFEFKRTEQDEIVKRQRQNEFMKEKEQHYKSLLEQLKPSNILKNLDEYDSYISTSSLLYISAKDYLPFIQRIFDLLANTDCVRNIASYFDNEKNFLSEEEMILWSRLRVYWSALFFATQRDLQTGSIPTLEELADLDKKFFEQFYLETKQMVEKHIQTHDKDIS